MTRIDDLAVASSARFSRDKTYRYSLTRDFAFDEPHNTAIFIMLNPSTADADVGDPTVRRCMRYTVDWGLNRLVVLNIFALRATDPKELYKHDDPAGPDNDWQIKTALAFNYGPGNVPPMVVCAWGSHGAYHYQGRHTINLIEAAGLTPFALRLNNDGQPAHPLYLPRNLHPTPLMHIVNPA